LAILGNEKILEVLNTYRESVIRNRRHYYARTIGAIRGEISGASAEMSFMPYVGKYVIEVAIVLGAIAVCAIQFATQDARHAVATLSVFLAASTRIAPAVLRLQQGIISIKSNLTQGEPTLGMMKEFSNAPFTSDDEPELKFEHPSFIPTIELKNVSFRYPESKTPAVSAISLAIKPGEVVAFVGPSGAGKTTLIDIILGVIPPDSGSVHISGLDPMQAISKWPGAIGYVPQDIVIADEDIRGNVSLGFPRDDAHLEYVSSSLSTAQLQEFVGSLPDNLDTKVGDKGAKLSGGQRQRLGIARALFTQPSLLVLDEATSSLDGETEEKVSNAIQLLRGRVTVLLVAHRLSTVREADRVFYLDKGTLRAQGKFEEVRNLIPDFDRQAKLMGL
jgi:ABC-type multidrug transport system fused ATPase/permease subunit